MLYLILHSAEFPCLYPILPPIRGSRDKPRELNLKSNLYNHYSCFFPLFYTLFLYPNNARVCLLHNCTQICPHCSRLFTQGLVFSPTSSIIVLPWENRLPLEPFAAGAKCKLSTAKPFICLSRRQSWEPLNPERAVSATPLPKRIKKNFQFLSRQAPLLDLTPYRWSISDPRYNPTDFTADSACGL
jgi:hypothetical protein